MKATVINRNLVIVAIVLITAIIFFLDLTTGPRLNEEFLFIIPILLTLWLPGKKSTVVVSIGLLVLTIIGYVVIHMTYYNFDFTFVNGNRLYALVGVLATTYVVLKNKEKEEIIEQVVEDLKISNKDLEQYAYVASHDLQEPLRIITNYIGLLEKRLGHDLDKDTADFLNRIVHSAEKMRSLIKEILYYSLIGKDRVIEKVDCEKVLISVLLDMNSLIEPSHAKIIADKLPVIESNETEMAQVFQHLISNAIKFKKKNTPPLIDISVVDRDKEWEFSVKDNGIGIEKEYFDKIFQIFQRLHTTDEYPGIGIGLAICKKVIQVNAGKIWVESTPDVGSTFHFTIPKNQQKDEIEV